MTGVQTCALPISDSDGDGWKDGIDPDPTNKWIPNLYVGGAGISAIGVSSILIRRKLQRKKGQKDGKKSKRSYEPARKEKPKAKRK